MKLEIEKATPKSALWTASLDASWDAVLGSGKVRPDGTLDARIAVETPDGLGFTVYAGSWLLVGSDSFRVCSDASYRKQCHGVAHTLTIDAPSKFG